MAERGTVEHHAWTTTHGTPHLEQAHNLFCIWRMALVTQQGAISNAVLQTLVLLRARPPCEFRPSLSHAFPVHHTLPYGASQPGQPRRKMRSSSESPGVPSLDPHQSPAHKKLSRWFCVGKSNSHTLLCLRYTDQMHSHRPGSRPQLAKHLPPEIRAKGRANVITELL